MHIKKLITIVTTPLLLISRDEAGNNILWIENKITEEDALNKTST